MNVIDLVLNRDRAGFDLKIFPFGYVLILLVSLLVITGCGDRSTESAFIARVGDRSITLDELKTAYGLNAEWLDPTDPAGRAHLEEAARRWALDELLVLEAERQQLQRDPDFVQRLETIRRSLLVTILLERTMNDVAVDSTEVYEQYDQRFQEYTTKKDQIELLYVLAPDRTLANQVRTSLQGGDILEEVLRIDDSLSGEVSGWVEEDGLNREVAHTGFTLPPGGVSAPIKLSSGEYIVLQCLQRRQAGTILPLDEVFDQIHNELLLDEKLRIERAIKDSLWVAYKPEFNFP